MANTLEKATSIVIRSLKPNKPYHVQWLVTRKCNYRCRGCSVWGEQDRRELSTAEVKRGLDILREMGVIEVVFSGGNPLLRDDIGEIIEYASRFFVTTVYDNGSMAVMKMEELRKADLVAISIDSLNPEKNDYVRGVKGAWHAAMEAVTKLHEDGLAVSVSPTISQFNLHEMLHFTEYFLSKGVPIWYSLYSYDAHKRDDQLFKIGKESDEFAIVDRQGIAELCDSLIEMKKKSGNIFMTNRILEAIKSIYSTGKRSWRCRALRNFFVIDHLGKVAGCHIHDAAATVFDLPKAWNSRKFDALRKTYGSCEQCTYMCYIFYSLHGSVLGNLQIAQDQWKNARVLLKRKSATLQDSAERR